MEKSWNEINSEVDLLLDHEEFSQKLILALFALSAITKLFHLPWVFGWLWVIPTFGYLLGRMAVDNWRCPHRYYWYLALGSQIVLAVMVGVPLAIHYMF